MINPHRGLQKLTKTFRKTKSIWKFATFHGRVVSLSETIDTSSFCTKSRPSQITFLMMQKSKRINSSSLPLTTFFWPICTLFWDASWSSAQATKGPKIVSCLARMAEEKSLSRRRVLFKPVMSKRILNNHVLKKNKLPGLSGFQSSPRETLIWAQSTLQNRPLLQARIGLA